MYLKLAIRNAKRSVFDYMLYITTMTILLAIMCVSNFLTYFSYTRSGVTMSLPLIIILIMVVLVNYINTFMMRQRAKEFANYLLLGMEKSKLLQMFLLEFCLIGIVCFFLGALIGTGIYLGVISRMIQGIDFQLLIMTKSIVLTFLFFVIVELFSAFRIRQKINKLQINELMHENRRNQPLKENRKTFWGIMFVICGVGVLLMLCGFVYLPLSIGYNIANVISLPIFFCIFAFYKWMYTFFSSKRLSQSDHLYEGNRLYRIAEMTKGTKTSALMNTIFCICLFLSAGCFVFGMFMFNSNVSFFGSADDAQTVQQWMGFIQISMSIIFITIYFSILSLQQIIDLKQQGRNICILYYMGKNQTQIKSMIKNQVMLKFLVPIMMCLILLLFGAPLINYKLNTVLPASLHNSLIMTIGWFIVCFAILYFCYFLVVYFISKRYLKAALHID